MTKFDALTRSESGSARIRVVSCELRRGLVVVLVVCDEHDPHHYAHRE